VLFSVGLLLLAASLVTLGVLAYKRSLLRTDALKIPPAFYQVLNMQLDKMEPAETLRAWAILRDEPLIDRERMSLPFEEDRKTDAMLRNRMTLAGGVGVAAAVLMAAGMLFKPRPKARAKRPRTPVEQA
jgi:hypothetical protein